MDADALIARYIEETPTKPGIADVRLVGYNVPLWALVGHLPAVDGDPCELARDYDLPEEVVRVALTFYERHRAVIDARVDANRIAPTH